MRWRRVIGTSGAPRSRFRGFVRVRIRGVRGRYPHSTLEEQGQPCDQHAGRTRSREIEIVGMHATPGYNLNANDLGDTQPHIVGERFSLSLLGEEGSCAAV